MACYDPSEEVKSRMGLPMLNDRRREQIAGVLACYDRILIQGTLPGHCYAGGMTGYLKARRIRVFDYAQWAQPLRETLRENAEHLAQGSLLAALEVQTGKVQSRCVARHTSEEFARFLDEAVVGQRRKQIHLIRDNLSTHKTAALRAWLKCHPQVQFHFTPTYSSWRNQVEIWLGMITRDGIRRGVFRSVPDLVSKLTAYARLYNCQAQPFRWTYRNPRRRIHVSPLSVTGHSDGVQWGGVIGIRTHLSSHETTGTSLTWTR